MRCADCKNFEPKFSRETRNLKTGTIRQGFTINGKLQFDPSTEEVASVYTETGSCETLNKNIVFYEDIYVSEDFGCKHFEQK
tara:strand:+ start:2200 stop:2445 length:246 start_codon:yes stop_codon:yes gene_type:complete